MNNQNIAICGLRYGKTKVQAEQIKKYIEENSLTEIKITILDSESKQKLEEIKKYCKEDSEYWGNDSYINGLNEGYKEAINGVLSIIGGE